MAGDGGEEIDEGIHDPLQQAHGHHVAVGDVAHLVAEHGLDFVGIHVMQQTGAHRDQ